MKFTNFAAYKIKSEVSTMVSGVGVLRKVYKRAEEVEKKAIFGGFSFALRLGGKVKALADLTKSLRGT